MSEVGYFLVGILVMYYVCMIVYKLTEESDSIDTVKQKPEYKFDVEKITSTKSLKVRTYHYSIHVRNKPSIEKTITETIIRQRNYYHPRDTKSVCFGISYDDEHPYGNNNIRLFIFNEYLYIKKDKIMDTLKSRVGEVFSDLEYINVEESEEAMDTTKRNILYNNGYNDGGRFIPYHEITGIEKTLVKTEDKEIEVYDYKLVMEEK